jgi:dihydrolipoamide dehydrogenase
VVAGDQSTPVDCLIIGGGPGGYVTALRAADQGRQVTLVESSRVGGICLNRGCIPSKALHRLAAAHREGRALEEAGLTWGSSGVDLSRFQDWKRRVVDRLVSGVEGLLSSRGVTVLAGEARFVGRTRVGVEQETEPVRFLDFRDVVIATGSRPMAPAGLEFDDRRLFDPSSALEWTDLPTRLVVAGADYLAVEAASAYARLGSAVTLIHPEPNLLPDFDSDLGRAAAAGLRALGVEHLPGMSLAGFEDAAPVLLSAEGERKLVPQPVIASCGRVPCLSQLDLRAAGLRAETGFLGVDDALRLERHVYALGDVTPGPALAHRAMAQGRVVGDLLGGRAAGFDPAVIPRLVFSEPELASVGLTLAEAGAAGIEATATRFPIGALGRSVIGEAGPGFAKLVVGADGRVLGAHLAGPAATEMIAEAALAIELGANVEDLALTVHAHPTYSEGIMEAAETHLGRSVHWHRQGIRK